MLKRYMYLVALLSVVVLNAASEDEQYSDDSVEVIVDDSSESAE